ncbi:MAG: hypothetical protein R3C04_09285 [Hyphomonas sp.]
MVRSLLLVLAACLFALAAGAEEKIKRFDVAIEVQADGDILVTETIDVSKATRSGVASSGSFRAISR